jgi:UDP-N-acetylmuramoyl-tripeptide--D-alanyl-D-alanine ligase
LFGKEKSSDFRLTDLKVRDGWVELEVNERWSFRFPGYAAFQAENALAALAVAFACGIPLKELPSVWKEIKFSPGRFELFSPRRGMTFINDCYNANPYSFEKALEAFEALEGGGRKVLVLGDMLELGSEAGVYHRALGEWIQGKNFQALLTLGHWMRETTLICERGGNPPLALHFEDKGMLTHFLNHFLKPGDQVLFKASRGIKLEEIMSAQSDSAAVQS